MKIQTTNNFYYKSQTFSPAKRNGVNVHFCSDIYADDSYRNAKEKQQKAREDVKKQRFIAFVSAVGLVVSGAAGIVASILLPNKPESSDIETPPAATDSPFDNDVDENLGILTDGNTQETTPQVTIEETIPPTTVIETTPETTVPAIEETIPETTIAETEPEITGTTGSSIPAEIEHIFAENPKVEEQYNKIIESLETFSEHLGEDGLEVIKASVEKYGDGKVEAIDILKLLFIESNGRIYNKNGNILKSGSGAYGALQITKPTEDYINEYYSLTGEDKLDVKNPYDNVDACVLLWRFLLEKRGGEIERGKWLPTGDDVKLAAAWSYHDGAWATNTTSHGRDYIQKFTALSLVDAYPTVVDYILNGAE